MIAVKDAGENLLDGISEALLKQEKFFDAATEYMNTIFEIGLS